MDKKISFEVQGFDVIDDYSDNQFAIAEIYVCHDGNNLHNMPIDLSVIKKAKKTLKNKFLVAGFDGDDFEGHEPDELIVGVFPESSEMKFVEKNGKTYLDPTDPPVFKETEVPNPNDPGSPDVIIIVDESGVPIGKYEKEKKDDGSFVYEDEDGVPM